MADSKLFDLSVELLHETEKAWLITDGEEKCWIPKSIGELEKEKDGSWTLTAPEWILKDKKLI